LRHVQTQTDACRNERKATAAARREADAERHE
jgi:hypothetical protein